MTVVYDVKFYYCNHPVIYRIQDKSTQKASLTQASAFIFCQINAKIL